MSDLNWHGGPATNTCRGCGRPWTEVRCCCDSGKTEKGWHVLGRCIECCHGAAVIASGATTEPVSDPYKFEWREDGGGYDLWMGGKIVAKIAPPTMHMNYYWVAGRTQGRNFCLADAQYAAIQAVKVNVELGNMVED